MRIPKLTTGPALFAACVLVLSGAARADDDVYFTTGIASSRFEGTAPVGCTLNRNSTTALGGGFAVGYRFAPALAIEFGYQGLGTHDIQGLCPVATPFTLVAPASGVIAAGVARWPMSGGWAAFGRIGAFRWNGSGQGGTDAVLGLGVEHEFDERFAVRAEYQALGGDLRAIEVGLRLGF